MVFFYTSNHCFRLKYDSSEIVDIPPVVSLIKIHPHIHLELFWTVLACKWCMIFLLIQMMQIFQRKKCYFGLRSRI